MGGTLFLSGTAPGSQFQSNNATIDVYHMPGDKNNYYNDSTLFGTSISSCSELIGNTRYCLLTVTVASDVSRLLVVSRCMLSAGCAFCAMY